MALWLGEATGAGRLVAVTAAQTVSVTHTHAAAAAAALGPRSHRGSAGSVLHIGVDILHEIAIVFFFVKVFGKQLPSSEVSQAQVCVSVTYMGKYMLNMYHFQRMCVFESC